MSKKHTRDEQRAREPEPKQGIIVPLDLPEFEILSQSTGLGESIEVHVIPPCVLSNHSQMGEIGH